MPHTNAVDFQSAPRRKHHAIVDLLVLPKAFSRLSVVVLPVVQQKREALCCGEHFEFFKHVDGRWEFHRDKESRERASSVGKSPLVAGSIGRR